MTNAPFPPEAFEQQVDFAEPRGRARAGWRLWYNTVYFVVLGAWSVAGSWERHRVLGIAAGLVYAELMLAAVRLATFSGGVIYEQHLARRIARPLIELCGRAGCAVPRVVIRDDAIRAAGVRQGRRRRVSLVVSGPFVDRLDDRQLRALLAHEVVHIVRNDFASARRRSLVAVVVMGAVAVWITVVSNGSVIFPVVLAVALVIGLGTNVGLSVFNRRFEWRADGEGAQLCGDAEGLASALAVAHTLSSEARLRVFGPLPWRWLLSPLSWTPPTHPRMARRIARLQRTAGTTHYAGA